MNGSPMQLYLVAPHPVLVVVIDAEDTRGCATILCVAQLLDHLCQIRKLQFYIVTGTDDHL